MKNKIKFYENNSIEILYAESSHSFPRHSHECFCFGFVVEGKILFSINNKQEILCKGMTFIIPSNVGITIKSQGKYKYVVICLKNEYKKIFENIEFKDYYFSLDSTEYLMALCLEYEQNNNAHKFINSILDIITVSIEHEFHTKEEKSNPIINEACDYIIKHVDEKFSLDELANKVHISKYHLVRLFKKKMGVTPNQYYIQAKVRCVKTEIFNDINGTELAAKLQFSDQSYLCKLFKRQMGISLKSYKKSLQRK